MLRTSDQTEVDGGRNANPGVCRVVFLVFAWSCFLSCSINTSFHQLALFFFSPLHYQDPGEDFDQVWLFTSHLYGGDGRRTPRFLMVVTAPATWLVSIVTATAKALVAVASVGAVAVALGGRATESIAASAALGAM